MWPYLFAAIPLIGGSLIGYLSGPKQGREWYNSLNKPTWTPPPWVFAPAWTILYILMGIASIPVYRKARRGNKLAIAGIAVYILSLIVNFAWSPVFFVLRKPEIALTLIILLLGLIVLTMILFSRLGGRTWLLLIPYLLWVTFATMLNASIVQRFKA